MRKKKIANERGGEKKMRVEEIKMMREKRD